jgi:hypothetical protein
LAIFLWPLIESFDAKKISNLSQKSLENSNL